MWLVKNDNTDLWLASLTHLSPVAMLWAPSATALSPDPQTMLTPMAGTSWGRPADTEAWRAGFWPRPAVNTWPRTTSDTSPADTLVLSRTSWIREIWWNYPLINISSPWWQRWQVDELEQLRNIPGMNQWEFSWQPRWPRQQPFSSDNNTVTDVRGRSKADQDMLVVRRADHTILWTQVQWIHLLH